MLKQGVAHVSNDFFAKPHDIVESHSRTHRQQQDNADHPAKILVHQRGIGSCKTVVDDPPHGNGNDESGH